MVKEKNLDGIQKKCRNCGASLIYSIKKEGLYCSSCQSVYKIETTNVNVKKPVESADLEFKEDDDSKRTFNCENCGAEISLKSYEIAKKCPYCGGSKVVSTSDIEGQRPDKIIRFTFEEDMIMTIFKSAISQKFLIPSRFKKMPPKNSWEKLYFPAFSFDAETKTRYSGVLYRNESDSRGHSYRRTFRVRGDLDLLQKNIVVESSSKLSQSVLHFVLPYDFSGAVDYNPSFILGYTVERNNDPFKKTLKDSEQIMERRLDEAIIQTYHADGITNLEKKTSFSNRVFEYVVLPIYILHYKYNKKDYTAYINGQTGKVGGKFPISPLKSCLVALLIILGIAFLVFLSNLDILID